MKKSLEEAEEIFYNVLKQWRSQGGCLDPPFAISSISGVSNFSTPSNTLSPFDQDQTSREH